MSRFPVSEMPTIRTIEDQHKYVLVSIRLDLQKAASTTQIIASAPSRVEIGRQKVFSASLSRVHRALPHLFADSKWTPVKPPARSHDKQRDEFSAPLQLTLCRISIESRYRFPIYAHSSRSQLSRAVYGTHSSACAVSRQRESDLRI